MKLFRQIQDQSSVEKFEQMNKFEVKKRKCFNRYIQDSLFYYLGKLGKVKYCLEYSPFSPIKFLPRSFLNLILRNYCVFPHPPPNSMGGTHNSYRTANPKFRLYLSIFPRRPQSQFFQSFLLLLFSILLFFSRNYLIFFSGKSFHCLSQFFSRFFSSGN